MKIESLPSYRFYLDQGEMYFKSGQIQRALNIYKHALSLYPNDAKFHNNLANCYLLLGQFSKGWLEYEWRLRVTEFAPMKFSPIPFWNGESLGNKIIAIMPEQGLGDAIQFVRYVSLLKEQGANVILGCRKPLYNLFNGIADDIGVIGENFSFQVHYQISLMSLPGIFKTTLETIPHQIPYILVPSNAGQKAISIIESSSKGFRVGLVWQGTTQRSLSLNQLSKLLAIEEVTFFSLQKGEAARALPDTIIDLGQYCGDFVDTAAAIQKLDLVISVDTSVAHLAGALGKPVWTMLPFVPDWRWMLFREDSPWYSTMRLFRQPKAGDWASVIKRVSEELKSLVGVK